MRMLSLVLVVAVLLCAPNSRGQGPRKDDGVKELAELDRQIAAKEKELAELKAKGVKLRDETPRIGHGGARIAFIDPASTGNLLIELAELHS